MKRQKKKYTISLLILLLLGIALGYAALNSNLSISGVSGISATTWDVHFDHIQETSGSVIPNSTTSINAAGNTVTFNVTLSTPGDFYEFTVDAVNAGTVDAMIESFSSTLNGGSISNLPDCLTYSVTYFDGVEIASNQLLAAGTAETYKVRVEFKTDIDEDDLPDSNQTLSFAFSVNYVQANSNAVLAVPLPVSFSTDSWPTIIRAVKLGNTSAYSVGDTKTVDMGTFGTHTLRIANKSTPSECSTTGFSQTACGFILEFADVITTHVMNSADTNVGGWPASSMRTSVNTDIYNTLPEGLRNAIINTTVVSGYGYNDTTNFTTTDKLYLLSTHEVWEDDDGDTSSGIDYYDTAYHNTRQLDYYAGLNVTTSSYAGAIKKRNGSNDYWWLRSAHSPYTYLFFDVGNYGTLSNSHANLTNGVSPAFRIG